MKLTNKKNYVSALLASSMLLSSHAYSSPYSFGGACQSQGSWTASALSQAESIKRIVLQLKDNPDCKGIESVLLSMEGAMGELRNATNMKDSSEYQSLPKDMGAMREVVESEGSGSALESVFNMSLDVTKFGAVKGLGERTARASDLGLRMLDETLNILPTFNKCLDSTDQGIALLGASLHLTNSFLQSGEGVLSQIGNTVGKFVTFLRENKYAKRLRELNEVEYMTSVSCLMETTADTYCSVNHAYDLLATSKQDLETLEKSIDKDDTTVPLEGYFLMVREVPIVTEWLQSVLYGVEPRTPHDAKFKETVQDNVNNFVKSRYSIMGVYNYELTLLNGLSDPQARKNHVLELLSKLLDSMSSGGRNSGDINFYFKAMRPEKIPFYLIGRNQVPSRVVPTDGSVPMRWSDFMKNTGGGGDGFIMEFDDPDALALSIGEKLRSLMEQSLVSASDYFRQQLIIDMGDLVARSVTSQTFSVFEAFENIRSYLDRMSNEILAGQGQKVILPNLLDTVHKLDMIIDVYEKNKAIIDEYQAMINSGVDREMIKEEIRTNDKLKKSYEEIVSNVYLGFNMLYQRDTFLTTRLRTFVRADYAYKTRNQENLTEHQKLVLTLSGKNMIERLMASHDKAPDLVALDLANAQVINTNNINVTGRLFDDALYNMILKLKLIEEGNYNKWNMNFATLNHIFKHSYRGWNKIAALFGVELYYNFLFNKPRYNAPSLFDFEHPSMKDDSNGSYAKMRAKLCAQSLMFNNRELFRHVCSGTKLQASFTVESKNIDKVIEVDYDEELDAIKRAEKLARKSRSNKEKIVAEAKVKEHAICSYNTYKKKNRAYWLLKNLNRP